MLKTAPQRLVVFPYETAHGLEVRIIPQLRAAGIAELRKAAESSRSRLLQIEQDYLQDPSPENLAKFNKGLVKK